MASHHLLMVQPLQLSLSVLDLSLEWFISYYSSSGLCSSFSVPERTRTVLHSQFKDVIWRFSVADVFSKDPSHCDDELTTRHIKKPWRRWKI